MTGADKLNRPSKIARILQIVAKLTVRKPQ